MVMFWVIQMVILSNPEAIGKHQRGNGSTARLASSPRASVWVWQALNERRAWRSTNSPWIVAFVWIEISKIHKNELKLRQSMAESILESFGWTVINFWVLILVDPLIHAESKGLGPDGWKTSEKWWFRTAFPLLPNGNFRGILWYFPFADQTIF